MSYIIGGPRTDQKHLADTAWRPPYSVGSFLSICYGLVEHTLHHLEFSHKTNATS